jgi:hypothetical protein
MQATDTSSYDMFHADLMNYLKELPDPYCTSDTPAMRAWFPLLADTVHVEVHHPATPDDAAFVSYSFARCVKCGGVKDSHDDEDKDIVRGYFCSSCAVLFQRQLDMGGIPLDDLYGKEETLDGNLYRQQYIEKIKRSRKERYPTSKCKSDPPSREKDVVME